MTFLKKLFHFHEWSKWTVEAKGNTCPAGDATRITGFWIRQTRKCETCGYVEIDVQEKS